MYFKWNYDRPKNITSDNNNIITDYNKYDLDDMPEYQDINVNKKVTIKMFIQNRLKRMFLKIQGKILFLEWII